MKPFLIVASDFVETGGMDRANHALARFLARRGHEVHLVAHRVADDLRHERNVVAHQVARPLRSNFLGEFVLDRAARHWARRITEAGGRVIVNGGNCPWADVNWVHYVWAAYRSASPMLRSRLLLAFKQRCFRRRERRALGKARLIIANSARTREDLVQGLGIDPAKVHVVYYGTDGGAFHPAPPEKRLRLRRELGWPDDRPVVSFIGALGDRRKGFDVLFAAWQRLCRQSDWNATLMAVGVGAEAGAWEQRAGAAGLGDRIRFLGLRDDVPRLLRASDLLVAPTRYEAYGLGVHEALCCGVPAMVSAQAGVAERYPAKLRPMLLLSDPENPRELADRLDDWARDPASCRAAVASFADALRQEHWDQMGEQILAALGSD